MNSETQTPHDAAEPAAPAPDASTAAASSAASAGTGVADLAVSGADCAEQLRQRFPALFVGAPKPLKLRIQADIRERAPGVFSKADLSGFLRRHTGRTGYLIALTRATQRFDLDGAPAGDVTAEHRQAALDELARRRELRDSREAQLEQQRRQRAELLRAFQGTSLSTANFCALKGVAVDQLDGLLALARQEAQTAAPRTPTDGPAPSRSPPSAHAAPGRHADAPGHRSGGERTPERGQGRPGSPRRGLGPRMRPR